MWRVKSTTVYPIVISTTGNVHVRCASQLKDPGVDRVLAAVQKAIVLNTCRIVPSLIIRKKGANRFWTSGRKKLPAFHFLALKILFVLFLFYFYLYLLPFSYSNLKWLSTYLLLRWSLVFIFSNFNLKILFK